MRDFKQHNESYLEGLKRLTSVKYKHNIYYNKAQREHNEKDPFMIILLLNRATTEIEFDDIAYISIVFSGWTQIQIESTPSQW